MVDIVDRLKYAGYNDARLAEAANEIERLRARLEVAFVTCNQLQAIACDFTITKHPCGSEDFHCGCEQMMARIKTPNADSTNRAR